MNNYPDVFHQQSVKSNPSVIVSNTKELTTIHHSPIQRGLNVIQDNSVRLGQSDHVWSNQRSYGNIVFGRNGPDNKAKINVEPYNRINKMNCPFSTSVDVKSAWN